MPQMVASADAENIMIPARDETVAQLAGIEAIRALTQQIDRLGRYIETLGEKQDRTNARLSDLHTEVMVMKQITERVERLERLQVDNHVDHDNRIRTLEFADVRLAGAKNGLETLRQWGPTLVGIIVAIIILVKIGALH